MTSDADQPLGSAGRALSEAISRARAEAPPQALAQRILAQAQYRELLTRELTSGARPRRFLPAAALVASAAAAAFSLRLAQAPSIEPERLERPAGAAPQHAPPPAPPPRRNPCSGRLRALGAAPLIDDFEDGDDAIAALEGRAGLWRWVRETDAPGSAPAALPIPRPGGTDRNRLALRVKGAALVDWGTALEFTFDPACYDASRYRGIAFQARGPGRLYFAPRETSVIPIAEGGTCELDCHNPHVTKIDLEKNWRTFEVSWADARQRGLGRPPLDASRLNSIAFLIRPEDTPYDVWIDDVRFVP